MPSSGLPALDELLHGGYPDKSAVLVVGPPGSGKDSLGYRFIQAGLEQGDFCLFITRLSVSEVLQDMSGFGIDLGKRGPSWLARDGSQIKCDVNNLANLSFNIKEILRQNAQRRIRIVTDILSSLLMVNPPEAVYKFLNQLLEEAKRYDFVLVTTVEEGMHKPETLAAMEQAFDGVILLKVLSDMTGMHSLLQIRKMRGVPRLLEMRLEVEQLPSTAQHDKSRIAVLPFANMSPDPSDEYFADGLTEELISTISRIRGFMVIARTSVMGYKGVSKKVDEIATELDVGALVEGSVRKAGNKLKITVQLIDPVTSSYLWGGSYDRELQDIFAVQSEVAEKIASSLQITLTDEDKRRIQKGGTSNVKAHNLYLKGRVNLWRFNESSLRSAIDSFESALAADPGYAQAYCGLSYAYASLASLELIAPKDAYEKAEGYARKALELDETYAEAHVALAGPLMNRYDFKGAIAESRIAIGLNPNLTEPYLWLPGLYLLEGNRDECVRAVEEELRLDPFSVNALGSAGIWYMVLGEYEKSVKCLKDALELDPGALAFLSNLSVALVRQGLIEEGLAEAKKAMDMGGASEDDLAYAYVKAGKPEEARKLLAMLQEPREGRHIPSTMVAGIHAMLGEKDEAIDWLERAFDERAGYLPWTMLDPLFESIWNEPRYLALVKKLGLGQTQ